MRPERQSEAAQDLTKPPSNAFGSPARVTLGLQPAADGSFAGMGSVLQLKNKSAPGTDRGQTLPYPRVWPLGEKDREVWPWGGGAGSGAGQECRSGRQTPIQGSRARSTHTDAAPGTTGDQGQGWSSPRVPAVPWGLPGQACHGSPEPCDTVAGVQGPPQHTCWLISGSSAPSNLVGEDKDALSFSSSSDG